MKILVLVEDIILVYDFDEKLVSFINNEYEIISIDNYSSCNPCDLSVNCAVEIRVLHAYVSSYVLEP